MASLLDLCDSRDIPLEIAEDIFYLAGPGALMAVHFSNKANAEAYSGVGRNELGQEGAMALLRSLVTMSCCS